LLDNLRICVAFVLLRPLNEQRQRIAIVTGRYHRFQLVDQVDVDVEIAAVQVEVARLVGVESTEHPVLVGSIRGIAVVIAVQ